MKKFFSLRPGDGRFARMRLGISLAILVLLAVICLIPGGAETFRHYAMKVIPAPAPTIIVMTGGARQRGVIQGKKLKWSIKLLDKIYIRHFAPGENLQLYLKKAEKLFSEISPEWGEEIGGMAEAAGVEDGILKLGNSFLDLGLNASGCRQIHMNLNGELLHSHNLDWDNLNGVGNYLVTIFRSSGKPGAYRTVHLGFPGMIGVLDIINEHGVALSFNQIGLGEKDHSRMPVFIAMREIAETCADFESAREKILNMPSGMPFCIGLSDAKSGKMAVFERDIGRGTTELPPDGPYLTADNSTRSGARHANPMQEMVRAAAPQNREDLIALLRDPKIMLGCNIYSVIFDYRNNAMYLASGEVPAAPGRYRTYKLFD